MNLPHLEPLLFAKEILEINKDEASTLCKFNEIPTLSMFIEAAAQSSSSFDTSKENAKIGFLTVAKNIELLNTLKNTAYILKLKEIIKINNMRQFSFEAFEKDTKLMVVSGTFTVLVKD